MSHNDISNREYLDLVQTNDKTLPEFVLLPHEMDAVNIAYEELQSSYQRIVDAKVSVSGGDDWHDGAFRATDNEAKVIAARSEKIAPLLDATIVSYPDEDEVRATLGSRALISQGGFSFPVDIVGFRQVYPMGVVDPESGEEVEAVSSDSPLGEALLGKVQGEAATYLNGERRFEATIVRLNQVAVREYFSNIQTLTEEKDESKSES
ncbi:MAG TPA: hypothetical protein PK096_03600 [Candidatus Saccharibacteria bacterium]|nr:hypothetical protein [Candidatus Saccharibacteria bacterium]HRK94428.1 hypothetical protein [Candidatus Saccharibacteria bacterium]